jgi:hypothetical protein
MIAAFTIPFVGTASAACTYSMTSVQTVAPNSDLSTTLEATFDAASLESLTAGTSASVYLDLPSNPNGYTWNAAEYTTKTTTVPSGSATVTVTAGTSTTEICATVSDVNATSSGIGTATSVTVEIPIDVHVPSGVSAGGVTLQASSQGASIFASGSVTIATAGNDTATVAVESTPSFSSGSGHGVGVIDVTENEVGALDSLYPSTTGTPSNTALTIELPPGFTWSSASATTVWGTDVPTVTVDSNDRQLDVYTTAPATGATAAYFKITGSVNVDETTAATGNITATVGGTVGANVGSLVVGTYGNYNLTVAASGTAPTINAGAEGSTLAELEIKEGISGSLIWGRTITLTLPSDVDWSQYPSLDSSLSTNTGSQTGFWSATDRSSAGDGWQTEGTNGNEIELTLPSAGSDLSGPTANNTSPGDFFLKNMEVTPAIDFSGPVVVTVGGSEGITGTVTLATVASPVTAAAASTTLPSVQIGSANQTLGDITVTEAAAGNIGSSLYYGGMYGGVTETYVGTSEDDGLVNNAIQTGTTDLDIVAPVGVTFDSTPTVTVTSGNLQLGTPSTSSGISVDGVTLAGNQGVLVIPINGSSTTASTISISAPEVTIDRTVPEGPVTFKVEGTALDQVTLPANTSQFYVNGASAKDDSFFTSVFPNDTYATTVDVATVATGAGNNTTSGTAVFTIGQTSYTLNGTSVTMDVAPFIQDSRTFLPLRYVANALGVADSNIMWDPISQKVTIIKGSSVAQFTIGSTTMLINGAAVTMDTAPEITDGRTCLPVAWAAEALGAQIAWDATAQTATITF